MKLIQLILVLLYLTVFDIDGLSQCYSVFAAKDTIQDTYNEPNYLFDFNTKISIDKHNSITLTVDSSYDNTISKPYILSNKSFGLYTKDSSKFQNQFIVNLTTNTSISLGCGTDINSICLKNCYVRLYRTPENGWRISVFDFKKSDVKYYNLSARNFAGYDDTCIFLYPSAFTFEKKKYYSGTIITLNENGIKIVKPVFKKNSFIDFKCIFYSHSFKVYKTLQEKLNKNCYSEDHISIRVTYFDQVIDSFEVIQSYFSNPIIQVKGDTLICIAGENEFGSTGNEVYRKYYKSVLIGEWKQSNWNDLFPFLNYNYTSYYTNGDVLFLKVKCNSNDSLNIQFINDKPYSLNGVLLKPGYNVYFIVIAFDSKTNKFLGYPEIVIN